MDTKERSDLPHDLADRLGALEAQLSEIIREHTDPSAFWEAFLEVADPIEAMAGPHHAVVEHRLAAMLAGTGAT